MGNSQKKARQKGQSFSQGNSAEEVLLKKEPIETYYTVDYNNVLGRGHYAVVNLGVNKKTGLQVAVKRIQISRSRIEALKREVEVLRKVGRHPNIVTLYDIFITDSELILVLELLLGGELFERMVEKGPYSEQEASHHIRKVGLALKFLHRAGIVHRDLKPENLILTHKGEGGELKIADFGLANMVDDAMNATMKTVCGTWAYCAPEVKTSVSGEGGPACYTAKVDLWSVGVILFVILAAYHPFDADGNATDAQLWSNICSGRFDFNDPAWQHISAGAKDLIKNLIVVDPNKRFGTDELLSHPWVQQRASVPATPITPSINHALIEYSDRRKSRKSWVGKVKFKMGGDNSHAAAAPAVVPPEDQFHGQPITAQDVIEQQRNLREQSRAELKKSFEPVFRSQANQLLRQHEIERNELLHRVQQMVLERERGNLPFNIKDYENYHAQQLAALQLLHQQQANLLEQQQTSEFENAWEMSQHQSAVQATCPRVDYQQSGSLPPAQAMMQEDEDESEDLPQLTLSTLLPPPQATQPPSANATV